MVRLGCLAESLLQRGELLLLARLELVPQLLRKRLRLRDARRVGLGFAAAAFAGGATADDGAHAPRRHIRQRCEKRRVRMGLQSHTLKPCWPNPAA